MIALFFGPGPGAVMIPQGIRGFLLTTKVAVAVWVTFLPFAIMSTAYCPGKSHLDVVMGAYPRCPGFKSLHRNQSHLLNSITYQSTTPKNTVTRLSPKPIQ